MKFVIEIESKAKARDLAETLRQLARDIDPNPEAGQEARDLYDVALQLAGSASNLDLGPELSTHRHATKAGAEMVAERMRPLTNAKIYVEHDPVDGHDKTRGVGDWNICYQNGRELDSCSSHRMGRLASMGETLALADALREHEPDHPLLKTWHLRPENRSNLSKYYA